MLLLDTLKGLDIISLMSYTSNRFEVRNPYISCKENLSTHRTLEAAEKAVLAYTRKNPTRAIPKIVDTTTGKCV